eukprot:gnl/TRDRNA2_/TRDRNA2_126777_c0_seq2.p1 gnl/TRDRNA2_/TRDRNA2_126777_c0~~gnl/TRDRNA2_/TRDRNA2_126777_c0_seq2.p1  ORF type:complete len:106 (+),score=7.83 gnl/TRDRNA2_/TRDRNA2_126777_c0_seq2:37-354(+)
MKRMRANAQAVFARLCGPNFAILRRAASDIECISGSSCQCSFAYDHDKMDISCELNSCSGFMAAAEIASRRGECIIALTAKDHAMPDRSCARNCQRILSADEEIA